jgi:hypothetical protein
MAEIGDGGAHAQSIAAKQFAKFLQRLAGRLI